MEVQLTPDVQAKLDDLTSKTGQASSEFVQDAMAGYFDDRCAFLRVHDYLIAYAPDEKPLWVVTVLHGRRNPRVAAAILRHRP